MNGFTKLRLGLEQPETLAPLQLALGLALAQQCFWTESFYQKALVHLGCPGQLAWIVGIAGLALCFRWGERFLLPLVFLFLLWAHTFGRAPSPASLRLQPALFGYFLLCLRFLVPTQGEHAPRLLGRAWGVSLPALYLSMVYFDSGLHKLTHWPQLWWSGDSLQFYLALRSTFFPLPAASEWLMSHQPARVAASMFTLVLELGFPFALLWRRARWFPAFLIGGLLFHGMVYWLMRIQFFTPFLACYYFQALPWERLARAWRTGA